MLNLCSHCSCVQILIFRGDISVYGNGRDTYKFRAIHPTMKNKNEIPHAHLSLTLHLDVKLMYSFHAPYLGKFDLPPYIRESFFLSDCIRALGSTM